MTLNSAKSNFEEDIGDDADPSALLCEGKQILSTVKPNGLESVFGKVEQRVISDFGIENDCMSAAVKKRRNEFHTGRTYARQALEILGVAAVAIEKGPDRAPIWPQGYIGSICHTDKFCGVVVGPVERCRGVGLDFERNLPLASDLITLVCTRAELRENRYGTAFSEGDIGKIIFVIKESIYKVYAPFTQSYLGFQDVQVLIDWEEMTFRVHFLEQYKETMLGGFDLLGRLHITPNFIFAITCMQKKIQ